MFNGGYGIKRRKMTVTSESSDDSRLLTKIREESRENEDDMCINESYCDKDKLFIGKQDAMSKEALEKTQLKQATKEIEEICNS